MAIATKVEPIDRETIFRATTGLSPQDQSKAVAAYARQAIAAADAQNAKAEGHPIAKTTFVDGSPSAEFERVRPNGTIVAEWDIGLELIQWIFEQLKTHAPVFRGTFKASITVYADGEEVEDMAHVPDASEFVFLPLVPYGRKIERGESPKAPDGVFEAVAALSKARFDNVANIRFSYRNPMGGANELEAWAGKHAAKIASHVARRRQYSVDTRQPAIIVTLK